MVGPLPTSADHYTPLKSEEPVITTRYCLDDINIGYADMHAGVNIRGIIEY